MVVRIDRFQSCVVNESAVISAAGTQSTAIRASGLLLTGLRFPASMTGTALSLQESVDGVTWTTIRINGEASDFAVTVAAGSTVVFANAVPLTAFEYLRLVSNSPEAAERSIGVLCRPI